eukprot:scaffold83551_cov50-Phaeocystis_antarctica.AAC.1
MGRSCVGCLAGVARRAPGVARLRWVAAVAPRVSGASRAVVGPAVRGSSCLPRATSTHAVGAVVARCAPGVCSPSQAGDGGGDGWPAPGLPVLSRAGAASARLLSPLSRGAARSAAACLRRRSPSQARPAAAAQAARRAIARRAVGSHRGAAQCQCGSSAVLGRQAARV